jgi:hypothetical protein
VQDSAAVPQSVFITVTVINQSALGLTPTTGTVVGIDNNPPAGNANGGCAGTDANAADDLTFTITGGTAPYSVLLSSNVNVIPVCATTIVGNSLTIDPESVGVNTTVTVTITDTLGIDTASVTITVTP